jgi:hypothetical protein
MRRDLIAPRVDDAISYSLLTCIVASPCIPVGNSGG